MALCLPPASPASAPSLACSALSCWLQLSTRRPRSRRPGSCPSCSPCALTASATSSASCSTPTPRELRPRRVSSSRPACLFPRCHHPAGDKAQAPVPQSVWVQSAMSPGCRGHLRLFPCGHSGAQCWEEGRGGPQGHLKALGLSCVPLAWWIQCAGKGRSWGSSARGRQHCWPMHRRGLFPPRALWEASPSLRPCP